MPHDDGLGREVITRYAVAQLANNGTWSTDSNGRDMLPRKRGFRPWPNGTVGESVAGNYAPITAAVEIAGDVAGAAAHDGEGSLARRLRGAEGDLSVPGDRDGGDSGGGGGYSAAGPLSLSIVVDRAQGGGTIVDGSVELLVHRRLYRDDGWGVEEPLNEGGVDGKGEGGRQARHGAMHTLRVREGGRWGWTVGRICSGRPG